MLNVGYICDRTKCGERCSSECLHTFDYSHAKNKDTIPDISKMFCSVEGDVTIFERKEKDDG